MNGAELAELQDAVHQVRVEDAVADYLLAIVEKTRTHDALALGVSPRGSQALYRAAQARAFAEGRTFAIPDDVKRLAVAVFGHRVMVQPRAAPVGGQRSHQGDQVIRDILNVVEVPL